MSAFTLSRRRILAFFATTLSGVALGKGSKSLEHLLLDPQGLTKVRGILRFHFALDESHDAVIRDFYKSLLTTGLHSENPDFFLEHLEKDALEDRLEGYVIEEFVVNTNYLEINEGRLNDLRFIHV